MWSLNFIVICQLDFHIFLSVHTGLKLVLHERTGGHQKNLELQCVVRGP